MKHTPVFVQSLFVAFMTLLLAACSQSPAFPAGDSGVPPVVSGPTEGELDQVDVDPQVASCGGVYDPGNIYPCCNNGSGNCTWYAAYRGAQAWGEWFHKYNLGNAGDWVTNALKAQEKNEPYFKGLEFSDSPRVGSIAVIYPNSTYRVGHVAWVESLVYSASGAVEKVVVSEQNCVLDMKGVRPTEFAVSTIKKYIDYKPFRTQISSRTAPNSAVAGSAVTFSFNASVPSGSVRSVEVNFGDGTPVASLPVQNGVASINKTFSKAGLFSWSATAFSDRGLKSNPVRGTINVSSPPVVNKVSLKSAFSSLCVDVPGSQTATGTHLVQWTCDATKENQKFQISPVSALTPDTFLLRLALNSTKCIAATASSSLVSIQDCQSGNLQHQWTLQTSASYKVIRNRGLNQCLDIFGPSSRLGDRFGVWTCNNQSNQQFTVLAR